MFKSVWIFNHYAQPDDLPGVTRHYDFGKELISRGHKILIFSSSFHHQLHKEVRLKNKSKYKLENIEGINFLWIRTPFYRGNDWRRVLNMFVFMLRAWKIGLKVPEIYSDINIPDVVIGSSPHLLAPLAAYFVARKYQVPFIMEIRDLWPQTIIDLNPKISWHPIIKVLKSVELFLYRKAAIIISVIPSANEYITSFGIPKEKIFWIPNGVDMSRFRNIISQKKEKKGFYVMYFGAHGQLNALDVIINAAKIIHDKGFDDIYFVFVGDGPEKPRLKKLTIKLGINNVIFYDPVPKKEIQNILSQADAFILNLESISVFKYGISPNKLFDYMAAARPIIFCVDALNNLVEEARCGLTALPRNPESIANAVLNLYKTTPEERLAMGERGRKFVEKNYEISGLAIKLERILSEVISNKGKIV